MFSSSNNNNSRGRYTALDGQTAPPPYSDEEKNLAAAAAENAGSGPASLPQKLPAEPQSSRLAVVGSVSFYLVAALVMVMVNKWVLNAVSVPLFFLLIQLLTAVALLHLTALFGFFKVPEVRVSTCKGLTPLIAINCIGLAFNTYCLQYVDASFYQVARGLVLPFTTILSYFLLGTKSSFLLLSAIGIVCFGFMVGVSSENLSVSGLGIFLGVCSSVTTAGHAIVVKKSLPVVNGSAMDLAYYSNFLSAFVMAPAALVAETGAVLQMFANGGEQLRTFWIGGLITGVFGFLICIAGFVSIKVTSPVTHMVSAAVRGVIQTVLGVWIFNDVVTHGRLSGITLILGGSILYTWLKDREMSQIRAAQKLANAIPLSVSKDASEAPNEVVFDMDHADKDDEDRALLEADALIAQEEASERRAVEQKL